MPPLYRSTIGKKILMAVSGIILVGYLLAHVTANLLIFTSVDALDAYAEFLKSKPFVLWPARAVLLAAALVHVGAAAQLTLRNRGARPVGYRRHSPQASTWASRSMRLGGVVILVFIVLHVLHFTTGTLHPSAPNFEPARVRDNVIAGFQSPVVVVLYLIAMVAVGLHLFHGLWSSSRTLGVRPESVQPQRRPLALAIAGFIWLGFTVIPLAVLFGLLA